MVHLEELSVDGNGGVAVHAPSLPDGKRLAQAGLGEVVDLALLGRVHERGRAPHQPGVGSGVVMAIRRSSPGRTAGSALAIPGGRARGTDSSTRDRSAGETRGNSGRGPARVLRCTSPRVSMTDPSLSSPAQRMTSIAGPFAPGVVLVNFSTVKSDEAVKV